MRKYLLLIFLFSLFSSLFSTTTYYDSIGTGKTYSTIALWESGTDNDLVSLDEIRVGVICNDLSITLAANYTISGATTDPLRYRMLIPKATHRFNGNAADTHIKITITGDYSFTISENYFKVKYLDFFGNDAGDAISVTACTNTEFWYCYFHDFDKWLRYYNTSTDWSDHYVINCAFKDLDWAAVTAEEYQVHVYNCVAYNCSDNDVNNGAAFLPENGRMGVVNTIAVNDDTTWYNYSYKIKNGGTGYWLEETRNNISPDYVVVGAYSVGKIDNDSVFVSTTDASMDFHLKSTNKTRQYIIDRGWYCYKNFSTFYNDIDDSARTTMSGNNPDIFHWDIGIDETSIEALPQTIRYVRKLANAGSDWVGLTPVYGTIDSAIRACDSFDIVFVASGQYNENIRCRKENIFIYGGFYGTETLLSQRQLREKFLFSDTSTFTIIRAVTDTNVFKTRKGVVLDGFHIRNGRSIRGAGFCASQDNNWSYDLSYTTVRNCRFDSCWSPYLYGWGSAVHIDNEPPNNAERGIIKAEFCYARICSAYCGIFEIMPGSYSAGQFINCMTYDCDGFGFEISVGDWAYFNDGDTSPGDCFTKGTHPNFTNDPDDCLDSLHLPWPINLNHRIINCISLLCTGNHNRVSIPFDPNYQSWAKDSHFLIHSFGGSTGINWGDRYDQISSIGSGIFWSLMSEVSGFLHQDSMTNKRLYFADSANGDWRPTGASPFAKGGVGGEYATYMGLLPPIQGIVTRISPMWIKK